MREHGLSTDEFPGDGRVDAARVERALSDAAPPQAAAKSISAPSHGDAIPLEQSPAKIIEAQTLIEVHRGAIPSTVSISLRCENADARLRRLAAEVGPVSLLELAIFEVARLLAEWPELNGFYADRRAWCYRSVAVGFAINLVKGLRVPVIKSTAERSLTEVMRSVRDLSLRYMREELQMDHLTGGSFTITDLSPYGVVHFIPVLNYPQSAILGICAERPETGSRDLVLTFDHRLSDGMRAAQFLAALRERLESNEG
jgi:pyruvate/2-oxoglutarate dehydrogenase complex dihydrolipoamide acyltransferase (E2) component